MKLPKGLALLEVILCSILLVGLIYLVMHTTSTYRQHEKAKELGVRLGSVVSEALTTDYSDDTVYYDHSEHNLIEETVFCSNRSGVLSDVSPDFLAGLKGSGFSLCNSTLIVGDPCDSSSCDSLCASHGEFNCVSPCQSSATPSCTYHCTRVYDPRSDSYSCSAVLDIS